MKLSEIYKQERTTLSFEVFPPKKESSVETVYNTVSELQGLKPDYISVTYGAGGSSVNNYTCDIASLIKNKYGIEAMAHLTCVNSKKADVDKVLKELKENKIENILALRGDKVPGIEPETDFKYANELVSYIKSEGDFGVSVAGYPETHFEAESSEQDIINLKNKVDCGAQGIVTQLFFDNGFFYDFRDKCVKKGISVPITAGIMPITSASQIKRMVTMCGASLPRKFVKMIQKYEDRPEALVDAGIIYAINQIVDLLSTGVDGIHLYTMNNPYVAKKITESIKGLL
ncbi:MAG: methylenetetrahydrofolate reductase [NAD(P)H] [Acutalibacteraceae bacterium]